MTSNQYNDLIAEAFVEPIRSVLIVDDDYPTLEEILLDDEERKARHGHKTWNDDADSRRKVNEVISEFRRPSSPNYILDIHDASSPGEGQDEEQAGELQQTDLLILDYELDKLERDDGSTAIRIARQALTNEHFNLILVHTNNDLDEIFYPFLAGVMGRRFEDAHSYASDAAKSFAEEHEVELSERIRAPQYVFAHDSEDAGDLKRLRGAIHDGSAPFSELTKYLDGTGLHRKEWLAVTKIALENFEISEDIAPAEDAAKVLRYNAEGIKFIRANRGFVAFKSKKDEGKLVPAIMEALTAWQPMPSRLTLTKLRAEMNKRGIEVQDHALGDTDVGALWYLNLLNEDGPNVNAKVDQIVRNHAEQLLDQLLPAVSDFTSRMRDVDAGRDACEVISERFSLNFNNGDELARAKIGHNAFVGSKPVRGVHLDIGHILHADKAFWLCLTPACDMVPRRHRGKPLDRLTGTKRFTALKLFEREELETLADANRGGQMFANIQVGEGPPVRKSFSFSSQLGAQPAWMTMYASNDGMLEIGDSLTSNISYVAPVTQDKIEKLAIHSKAFTVCGMLRYEYALEVQSHFAASQSRIGLDFENFPIATVPETPIGENMDGSSVPK